MKWTKAQKRCYNRVLAGIYRHRDETLRFLTLTTSNDTKDIQYCFRRLYFRIIRIKPYQLIENGFIDYNKACRIYGINDLGFPLNQFDYIRISTGEGVSGVYHILYYGNFYPRDWLIEQWEDIAKAWNVDIRQVKTKNCYDPEGLARYIINQYVVGQSKFLNYNISNEWCIKGFVGLWNSIKEGLKYPIDQETSFGNQKYSYDLNEVVDVFRAHIDEYRRVNY